MVPIPALFDMLDEQGKPKPAYHTKYGRAYCMDSLKLMRSLPESSVDLIITSPPYALVKKKEYGNEDSDQYVRWFMKFASEFWRILKPKGSLVLNIGGAYERGRPTRSLCHFEVLLKLCSKRRKPHFHLAQEFYWFNPAKMPAPAEWVTIRRVRVRDSVEPLWWLSKDPDPIANNRRVLTAYGESMKQLLKNGYNKGPRPSGHDVSDKWDRDNGGAIPPNLLRLEHWQEDAEELLQHLFVNNLIELANTSSNDRYRRLCKEREIKPHPATFPVGLPQFFIKFLTEPEAVVFDPFGGSGTTGLAAQNEGRYWITCDLDADYVQASRLRFPELDENPGQQSLF